MNTFILEPQENYQLLDSGEGLKLEKFGKYITCRPDPNVLWEKKSPLLWEKADAIFDPQQKFGSTHWNNKNIKEDWIFEMKITSLISNLKEEKSEIFEKIKEKKIKMILKLTPFKHVGLFPEQIKNWQWLANLLIKKKVTKESPRVLNLFGYTAGASLVLAALGAKVTHVDASRPTISWAKENQKASNLEKAQIRWIVDDARKFVNREIRRKSYYDAVVMDPPAFGRDPKGKVFKFEKDVLPLLKSLSQILSPDPLFFLFNSYSLGYSATVIKNILSSILPLNKIEAGEIQIQEISGQRNLPAGVFARFPKIDN
ncbi:MAG: class I SAM-dependent methyltransferase [Patescibacteria group bacterium]|nr:class I SAM-dependent methyltransferase [Patescibacteria group bacterium]